MKPFTYERATSPQAAAAAAARAAGRPVKIALDRPLIPNNTTHRPATIQRIRLGAGRDGKLTAIAHESWSGNLPGGSPETAVQQTRLLYAGARGALARRAGHGGGVPQQPAGEVGRAGAAGCERNRHRRNRHDRHRHRQLHHPGADRRRDDGAAVAEGDGTTRRFRVPGIVRLRRPVRRQQLDLGRVRRLHEAARGGGAKSACAACCSTGCRRSLSAAPATNRRIRRR